jgi:protein-tyrosine kinase
MSRIHEALKKAELERQKALGSKSGSLMSKAIGTRTKSLPSGEKPEDSGPSNEYTPSLEGAESASKLAEEGVSPQGKPDPSRMLFLGDSPAGPGVEAFRTLGTRLYLLKRQRPLQKILVTSPFSEDGKTFVSANLAQALAQQGHRVLLIDADLRFSTLHVAFGAAPEPGLTEYLIGECDPESIMQKSPLDNLFLIAGGKHMEAATELLANGRLEELLVSLSPDFNWIVFDSPPVVPVSDAKIIGELCDGAIVVARSGATTLTWAQKACREVGETNLLGVVLNRVNPKAGRGSSYDYSKNKGSKSSGS